MARRRQPTGLRVMVMKENSGGGCGCVCFAVRWLSAQTRSNMCMICIGGGGGGALTFLDQLEGSQCLPSASPVTATDGHPIPESPPPPTGVNSHPHAPSFPPSLDNLPPHLASPSCCSSKKEPQLPRHPLVKSSLPLPRLPCSHHSAPVRIPLRGDKVFTWLPFFLFFLLWGWVMSGGRRERRSVLVR